MHQKPLCLFARDLLHSKCVLKYPVYTSGWGLKHHDLLAKMQTIPGYFVLKGQSWREISLFINIFWQPMLCRVCPSKVNNTNDRLHLICLLGRHLAFTKLFNYGKQSSHRHHSCVYLIIINNVFLLLTNLCKWLVHDFYDLCLNLWVNLPFLWNITLISVMYRRHV